MSVLAVDLGGTVIKCGLVRDGRVVGRRVLEGRSEAGIGQVLPRLAGVLRELRGDGGVVGVVGVGIALPTLVDVRTNRVLGDMVGKYEGLRGMDVEGWVRGEFGLPVRLENDAHAAMLGEWRYGAGKGSDDLVMVTLGTGIGSSVVIQGKCLRGKHGQAGNLGGHFVIDPAGFACGCGAAGCIEAMQHRSALERLAVADGRYAGSALRAGGVIDYEALFRLAGSDGLARDLRDRSMELWGAMVVSLIHQFDCERVIVGGGVMRSADVILPVLRRHAARACTPWGQAEVVAGSLGDDAALIGLASSIEQPPEYL